MIAPQPETNEQAQHEKAMQIGSASLAKAIYVAKMGRGPGVSRDFIWTRMGLVPATGPTLERDRIVAERNASQWASVEALRVNREICPMCGVRSDIGCKHRRAA